MKDYIITPNLAELMGKSDSESIQNAVNHACASGVNSVTIPRINQRTGEPLWSIDKAIILPSNMEIVLDNCHLRQADGCFDNLFRNFANIETDGHTLAERKNNIVIRGLGNAVLDGGNHNGLTQLNALTNGLPHIAYNNLILLYNLRDFVLEGFEIRDHRYWAINLIHAERGRLSDIYVNGQCDCRNQDAIDLRVGCSNIIIERITGQTGDDIIALSAIGNTENPKSMCATFAVEGHDEDIHDIIIKDIIATSVECTVIALRNCDGRKIYNVTIDNIHCTDNYALQDGKHYPEYPKFKLYTKNILHRIRQSNMPYALIRIGQDGFFGKRNAQLGELYNVHATNLHTHIGAVIVANVAMSNCYFGNIYAENTVDYILTTKSERLSQVFGADMKNVIIENVFYNNTDNEYATAFDLDLNKRDFKIEHLIVRSAFLGNCKHPFSVKCDGVLRYSEVYGENVDQPSGAIERTEMPVLESPLT